MTIGSHVLDDAVERVTSQRHCAPDTGALARLFGSGAAPAKHEENGP